MNLNECEHLPGRARAICEGTAPLPLARINTYRLVWGLSPLTQLPDQDTQSRHLINRTSSVGISQTNSVAASVGKKTCGGCGGSKPLPSISQQAFNYGKALVRHALNPGLVSPELAKARLAVCETCEWFRPEDRRCAHPSCGCFLDEKATWKSEDCPIKKWPESIPALNWSYGLTTVPERIKSELPKTLASLKAAGFDNPRLFIDGARDAVAYADFGLETTCHYPTLKTFGNWILCLLELYLRDPEADRYAIFQDDFVTYPHLKEYLEQSPYPDKGYLNLYTFPENQKLVPDGHTGWYEANQRGLGAVALVFNREAIMTLLESQSIAKRPQDSNGWKRIDGGIVNAFNKAGWKEYVHNPSLVQHTGLRSSMGNSQHQLATSFKGQEFNALDLLG